VDTQHIPRQIALIVIFNHRYDANIPLLESIYRTRFSNRFYLMPFYDGSVPNIIPVYENSWCFQGYLTQGARHFLHQQFSHYVFIHDDLLLNPTINEQNLLSVLDVDQNTAYIDHYIELHARKFWYWMPAAIDFLKNAEGSEGLKYLPDYATAQARLAHFNLEARPVRGEQFLYRTPPPKDTPLYQEYLTEKDTIYSLPYPMLSGYADMFMLPAKNIHAFLHLCGILASMRLFVEIAIPTALVFLYDRIITSQDAKGYTGGYSQFVKNNELDYEGFHALKQYEYFELMHNAQGSLENLLRQFPKDLLFYHPIKLSTFHNSTLSVSHSRKKFYFY